MCLSMKGCLSSYVLQDDPSCGVIGLCQAAESALTVVAKLEAYRTAPCSLVFILCDSEIIHYSMHRSCVICRI